MGNRIKWTERTFKFDYPIDLFPEVIERYRGTPPRVEDLVRGSDEVVCKTRHADTWSIQENIGHLLDLEPLTMRRLDEYESGAPQLSAADMTNRQTHEARHNERPLAETLRRFRDERMLIVGRLEALPPERFARTSIHPRLKVAMRLVDFVYFQAEHDDYHLARISELIRLFRAR